MRPGHEERREFQRLELSPSVPATFNGVGVAVLEAGVIGARIFHEEPLGEERGELRFSWGGQEIALRCAVVRTVPRKDGRGSESGLRFVAALEDCGDHLRMMLTDLVVLYLQGRETERPISDLDPEPVDGDRTVRGSDAPFLSYRLDGGVWRRRAVFLPEQPASGFTVGRNLDYTELQSLCRVYEVSDEEGRRLIRMFAEVSVSSALQIPPRAADAAEEKPQT